MNRPLPRTSLAKIPSQERSVATVHAMLDAAVRVLLEEGAEGFSTNRVAEVAGVSVGSLYQYFTNKEALVAGVVERAVLTAEAVTNSLAFSDDDVENIVRQVLLALLDQFESRGQLARSIFEVAPTFTGNALATILEVRLTDLVRNWLLRNAHRYRFKGNMSTLYVAINGAIYVVVKWMNERPASVPREELVESIVDLLTLSIEPV